MLESMTPDSLETFWRNAACAVASGFTTYTVATWVGSGHPEPAFVVACALVWLLVSASFLPRDSAG